MNFAMRLGWFGVFCAIAAAGLGQAVPPRWPTADGTYTIAHFQFKDGETIDALFNTADRALYKMKGRPEGIHTLARIAACL